MATKNPAPRDPVRRWTLIVLGLIVVLFAEGGESSPVCVVGLVTCWPGPRTAADR
jgi:hypothetical protein